MKGLVVRAALDVHAPVRRQVLSEMIEQRAGLHAGASGGVKEPDREEELVGMWCALDTAITVMQYSLARTSHGCSATDLS